MTTMERVVVSREFMGLFSMQVCAVKDATDEEILEVCRAKNPVGTSNDWCRVIRSDEERTGRNPVQCEEHEDRLHFLVDC